MDSPSKKEINYALSPMASDEMSNHILRSAYKEAIEALKEITTAKTSDGQELAIKEARRVIEKYPVEKYPEEE